MLANNRLFTYCNRYQLSCQVRQVLVLTLIGLLLVLSACNKRYDDLPAGHPLTWYSDEYQGVGRFKTSYLVDQLDEYYRGTNPGPIGVSTFVNVDDLYNSSTFGRVISEQVMSELSMRGFDVVELRHSDAMQFLASDGEFAMSRDVAMVRRERDLGGVLVGTYTISPIRVYLNARLVDPSNSHVVAAGSVEMSKTKEIARLLRGGAFPSTLERIPVKSLNNKSYPMWGNPQAEIINSWENEESAVTNMPVPSMPKVVPGTPAKK